MKAFIIMHPAKGFILGSVRKTERASKMSARKLGLYSSAFSPWARLEKAGYRIAKVNIKVVQ